MGSSSPMVLLQPPEGRTKGFVHFFPGRRRKPIIHAPIMIVLLIFLDIRRTLDPPAITENHPSPSRRLITPLITAPSRQLRLTTPPADHHQPAPYHYTARQTQTKQNISRQHAGVATTTAPRLPRRSRRPLCYASGAGPSGRLRYMISYMIS